MLDSNWSLFLQPTTVASTTPDDIDQEMAHCESSSFGTCDSSYRILLNASSLNSEKIRQV